MAQARALDEHCGKCCHDPGDTMPPPARVPRELRTTEPSTASPTSDEVKSPAHYTRYQPEPRSILLQWRPPHPIANVIKYALRAGHKVRPGETARTAALRDLRKARENLDDEIKHWEGKA